MKPKRRWRPGRRKKSEPIQLAEGAIEYEFGVPIEGKILAREAWTQCALKRLPQEGVVDWGQVFGREAPLVVDIGCGNGRYTIASAIQRPEMNHLAIDSLPMVVRYGTRRANQRGLQHVRFAVVDGWRFLHSYCQDASIAEVHIYHPQPYADPDDISKRMLNPEFMGWMYRRLVIGGRVYFQTDREAYWQYVDRWMPRLFQWGAVEGQWSDGPEFRSRREILSRKEGLSIYRGIGVKSQELTGDQVSVLVSEMEQPTFAIDEED